MSIADRVTVHPEADEAPDVGHDWFMHAPALAAWVDKNMVNRRDAYGGYYAKDGSTRQTTRKTADGAQPLSLTTLIRHFKADDTDDVIGLHAIALDEDGRSVSRWALADIDRHGDDGDPEANFRAALAWHDAAASLGFTPLLLDSNGRGGYHLVLLFSGAIPAALAFAFVRWLTRDWEELGLKKEVETFPKQPGIAPGKFGNWCRLPGRHHTRQHYSRVWSGSRWLDGAAAIRVIMKAEGTDQSAIPDDARPRAAAFDMDREIERKRSGLEGGPRRPASEDGTLEPGEDFNARATWKEILEPAGWVLDHEDEEGVGFWRRPGKAAGWSGTTDHTGNDTFHPFTDATAFEQDGSYSKFGAYSLLKHQGDFTQATKHLSGLRYGTFNAWVWREDENAGAYFEDVLQNPCPDGGWVRIRKPGEPAPPFPPKDSVHAREWTTRGSRKKERGKSGESSAAPEATADAKSRAGGPTGPGTLPEIEVNTEWYRVVDAGIEALKADPDLYSRGGSLVNVIQETEEELRISTRLAIKGVAGSPKVVQTSDANIGCRLTQFASLYSWKPDKSGEFISVSVRPPDWMIKAISTRKHWPGIRRLEAVVECPFPRPDGSIVEAKGYDRATATLYLPSIEFPPVPERPTRDDARAAWGRIKAYIREFPFATEDDRVVYLAGLLTVIARPAIVEAVPGIAVVGNKAGTGKGLLIDAMTIPGTGRPCPTSTYPESNEEATKVKVSIAKAAKVAVHFDNLEEGSSYGSGPLDSALTSTVTDDRQLGSNDSPPLPLRPAWFLSGNNVYPCKDAHRRWLVCNLETELENPEERTDIEQKALRATILQDRGEIVRDALTILRAHWLEGRPRKPDWPGFGSFEDWDLVVRGAVWFATDLDCLTTQRRAAADSPDRSEKLALLEGIWELEDAHFGKKGMTSVEIVREAEGFPDKYPTLHAALKARGRAGKLADSRQLGNILRGLANATVGRFKLLKHPTLKHQAVAWVVQEIKDQKGSLGV